MKREVNDSHRYKTNYVQDRNKPTRNNSKKDSMSEIVTTSETLRRKYNNLKNN